MEKESGDWSAYPTTNVPDGGGTMGSTNNTVGIGMGWFPDVLLDEHDYMTIHLLVFIVGCVVFIGAVSAWKLCRYIRKRSTYQDSIQMALKRGRMYNPSAGENGVVKNKNKKAN